MCFIIPSAASLSSPQAHTTYILAAAPALHAHMHVQACCCRASGASTCTVRELQDSSHLTTATLMCRIRVGNQRLVGQLERQQEAARKRERDLREAVKELRKGTDELQSQLRASQVRTAASEQYQHAYDITRAELGQKDTQIGLLEAKVERRNERIAQLQQKCEHLEAQAASSAAAQGTEALAHVLGCHNPLPLPLPSALSLRDSMSQVVPSLTRTPTSTAALLSRYGALCGIISLLLSFS